MTVQVGLHVDGHEHSVVNLDPSIAGRWHPVLNDSTWFVQSLDAHAESSGCPNHMHTVPRAHTESLRCPSSALDPAGGMLFLQRITTDVRRKCVHSCIHVHVSPTLGATASVLSPGLKLSTSLSPASSVAYSISGAPNASSRNMKGPRDVPHDLVGRAFVECATKARLRGGLNLECLENAVTNCACMLHGNLDKRVELNTT